MNPRVLGEIGLVAIMANHQWLPSDHVLGLRPGLCCWAMVTPISLKAIAWGCATVGKKAPLPCHSEGALILEVSMFCQRFGARNSDFEFFFVKSEGDSRTLGNAFV